MATLRVLIDAAQSLVGAKVFEQAGQRISNAAIAADAQLTSLTKSIRGTAGGLISLRSTLVATAGAFAIRAIANAADEFTTLENRIRLVTDSQEELADVTETLSRVSNASRTSFRDTTELFVRTSIAVKDLGRSQFELIQFTDKLNKAILTSGATAREASQALIQLSQGLASNTLRGDELRAVLEQLPVVADVIAQSLGVTRGELRELGKAGVITAEVILDAFKEAGDSLDEDFGQLIPTIGQSLAVLRNEFVRLSGASSSFNRITAASVRIFAGAIGELADGLDNVDDSLGFFQRIAQGFEVTADLATGAKIAIDSFGEEIEIFSARGLGSLIGESIARGFGAGGAIEVLGAAQVEVRKLNTELHENAVELNEVTTQLFRFRNLADFRGIPDDAATKLAEFIAVLEKAQRALTAEGVELRKRKGLIDELVAAPDPIQPLLDAIEKESDLLKLNARDREVANDLRKLEAEFVKAGGEAFTDTEVLQKQLNLAIAAGNDVLADKIRMQIEDKDTIEARVTAALRQLQIEEERAELLDRINGPQEKFIELSERLNELELAGTITKEQRIKLEKELREEILGVTDVVGERIEELEKEIAITQKRIELSDLTSTATKEEAALEVELAQAVKDGNEELAERIRMLIALNEELKGVEDAQKAFEEAQKEAKKAQEEAQRDIERFSEFIGGELADSLNQIIFDSEDVGETFRELGRSLLRTASDAALKAAIAELVALIASLRRASGGGAGFGGPTSITTGLTGNGFVSSFFGNAKGNAFSGGSLVPFQRGGVVNTPTLFPLAGNRTGIVSETGQEEGIFPLQRDSQGNLGVSASGGGRNVNITQNISTPDANSFRRSSRQITQDARAMIRG